MARTRSGQALIDDAYDRSDTIGAVARHPRANVLRYVNQGAAELWDLLIQARGPEFWRATAQEITTTADTTTYTLNTAFYMLVSVHVKDASGEGNEPLVPFTTQEEPNLRDQANGSDGFPTHYQLRRTTAGVDSLTVLPEHEAGNTIVVDYVPVFTDLTDAADSYFYGVNGWEEYIVEYAAKKIATKDEEWALANECDKSMQRLRERISGLTSKRDMHRARRVKDVRGARTLWRRS